MFPLDIEIQTEARKQCRDSGTGEIAEVSTVGHFGDGCLHVHEAGVFSMQGKVSLNQMAERSLCS